MLKLCSVMFAAVTLAAVTFAAVMFAALTVSAVTVAAVMFADSVAVWAAVDAAVLADVIVLSVLGMLCLNCLLLLHRLHVRRSAAAAEQVHAAE